MPLAIQNGDNVLCVFSQSTKPFFALLQRPFRLLTQAVILKLPQCALNRRKELLGPVFENIISSSVFQALDGHLFANRTRKEDEWRVGLFVLRPLQGGSSIVGWQRKVGD